MLRGIQTIDIKQPGLLFCLGWAVVMLALTVAIPPVWNTFMHPWRVDLIASLFLFGTLSYGLYCHREKVSKLNISRDELNLLVFPISAFILWSAISIMWAPSWKSAVHHTLVWSEYLIFYIAVRQILAGETNYGRLLKMLSLTLAFFAVLAVFAYCALLVYGTGTSIGIVYAKYGEQVNTIFPLLTVGVLRLSGKRFIQGTIVLAVLGLLVFCSLGRTNLILFSFGTLATALTIFCFKRFHKYRLKMAVVAVVLVLAPIPFHLLSLISDDPDVPFVSRVADEAGISSSNNFRKLMMSLSMEMFAAHPVIGVGADNFGLEANKYRAAYAAKNPDNGNLAQAESDIPERAHNEYLQIMAELGFVGGAIFLWLLGGVGVMVFRAFKRRRTISLFPIAALLGIVIFLTSSLVTSYSFRLIQNGFVFFFVLAVAAKLLLKDNVGDKCVTPLNLSRTQLRLGYAVGIVACCLLMAYSAVRVTSVMYATKADHTANLNEAIPFYKTAMQLDDENPEAPYFLGLRLVDNGRYSAAVPFLEDSIRIGKARSADFSFLATAQLLAGDPAGAERTFAAASALYPRSPFVLTRYAALLRDNGKDEESAIQLERAKLINAKQANTWWIMITVSPQAAADQAIRSNDHAALMDLQPQASMYAMKAEREIRFPRERFKF